MKFRKNQQLKALWQQKASKIKTFMEVEGGGGGEEGRGRRGADSVGIGEDGEGGGRREDCDLRRGC